MAQTQPKLLMLILFVVLSNLSFSQRTVPHLLSYADAKGQILPLKTLSDWQKKRGQILDSMQALFGTLPGDPDQPPFEPRIKVVVSSCGWTLRRYYNNYNEVMRKKTGSRWWGSAQKRYAPLAETKYQLRVEQFPFDFDELIAAIAPRPFFSNSPIHDANFNVEGVRVGIANAS